MSWYRNRVERDLARWQTSGWVSEAGASAIRADLASRKSPFGVAPIFATLGAVLFGFAVMSFVAAHWEGMSKLARLALLLVTLWGCYGAAYALFQRRLEAFAQAAVLGGIAVFGASIMLIAQMYHMEGNPPDAVLMWAMGALLAAVLVQSRPALAATFVLLVVWSCYERGLSNGAHWSFLPVWAAAAAGGGLAGLASGPAPGRHQPCDLARPARLLRARPARALDRGGWSACSRPSVPLRRGRRSTGASRPPPRCSPMA